MKTTEADARMVNLFFRVIRRPISRILLPVVLASVSVSYPAQATEQASAKHSEGPTMHVPVESGKLVEVFIPPEVQQKSKTKYPEHKRQQGQEGWVDLNFMIDQEGRPYDITVVASTDPAFDRAAVRSLSKWKYAPATLGPTPIDAGAFQRFTFSLTGEAGARPNFARHYKQFKKAMQKQEKNQNPETLNKTYDKLVDTSRNLYEEAYFQLASYLYRKTIGAPIAEQYASLTWASSFDRNEQYLPGELTNSLMATRLTLELELNQLAEAQRTAQKLIMREAPPEYLERAQKVLEHVEQIRVSKHVFSVRSRIPDSNRGYYRLLKNTFAFRDIEGDIAELRLHCDRGYVGFIYEPNMVYKIDQTLRACSLIIIGDPGTTFTLTEGA